MATMLRDFYEVLEITDRRCSEEEVKAAYKKAALKWHPDRNMGRAELATERFKEVRHAYSVLSDKNERKWYDDHREEILRGGDGTGDVSDDDDNEVSGSGGTRATARRPPQGPNVMVFYARSVYADYDDKPKGFYTVFTGLFDELDRLEREWYYRDAPKGSGPYQASPPFGRANASANEVLAFYSHWCDFVSVRSFAECDRYNPNDAENRRIRRAMEAENARFRKTERTKMQSDIRDLAAFLKKRDPRIVEIAKQQKLDAEAAELRKLQEKVRAKEEFAAAREAWRAEEAAALLAQAEDERRNGYHGPVRLADEDSDDDGKKGRKGKKGGKKGKAGSKKAAGTSNSSSGGVAASGGDGVDSSNVEDFDGRDEAEGTVQNDNESEQDESEDEEDEEEEPAFYRCEICSGKDFKSKSQYDNHLNSKAHKKKVAEFVKLEKQAERAAAKAAKSAAKAQPSKTNTRNVGGDGSDGSSDEYESANEDLSPTTAQTPSSSSTPSVRGQDARGTVTTTTDATTAPSPSGDGGDDSDSDESSDDDFLERLAAQQAKKKKKKQQKGQLGLARGLNTAAAPVLSGETNTANDADDDDETAAAKATSEAVAEDAELAEALAASLNTTESPDDRSSNETAATATAGASATAASQSPLTSGRNGKIVVDANTSSESEDEEDKEPASAPPLEQDEEYSIINTAESAPKSKGKKGKANTKAAGGASAAAGADGGFQCRGCSLAFMTRSALFRHLEDTGHAVASSVPLRPGGSTELKGKDKKKKTARTKERRSHCG